MIAAARLLPPGGRGPRLLRALAAPVVGRVLRLVLVGEPPMAYLAGWRLALAAARLRETDDTLEAIARHVGYGGGFARSSAFNRVYGVSPQEHRTRAA